MQTLKVFLATSIIVGSLLGLDSPSYASEVPLALASGALVVPIKIGKKRLWMALDTGSKVNILDPTIKLDTPDPVSKPFPSGGYSACSVKVVTIGGMEVKDSLFYLPSPGYPLGAHIPGTKERVSGILGYSLLSHLSLDFDFIKWTLNVDQGDVPQKAFYKNYSLLGKFSFDEYSLPAIKCNYGKKPLWAVLDLGSFISGVPYSKTTSLHVRFKGPPLEYSSFSGPEKAYPFVVENYRIGPFTWPYSAQLAYKRSGGRKTANLVGLMALITLNRVEINFLSSKVYALRSKRTISYLDSYFAQTGVILEDNQITILGGEHIAWRDVMAICGVPVKAQKMPAWIDVYNPAQSFGKDGMVMSKFGEITYVVNGKSITHRGVACLDVPAKEQSAMPK